MTRLNQIIALRAGAIADRDRAVAGARAALKSEKALKGIVRVHRPLDEQASGDALLLVPPDETHGVQITAQAVLEAASRPWVRLMDLERTREQSNGQAAADVVLEDGTVLLVQVPATYLLFLERELREVQRVLADLPRLDPAERWEPDPSQGEGTWRSQAAEVNVTKRMRHNWVKFAGDVNHEPQIDVYEEDTPVARRTTWQLSGAMEIDRIRELQERCAEMLAAVLKAREEANSMEVTDARAGAAVFRYLMDGAVR